MEYRTEPKLSTTRRMAAYDRPAYIDVFRESLRLPRRHLHATLCASGTLRNGRAAAGCCLETAELGPSAF